MPRGSNEAFKEQQGRFSQVSRDEARAAGRKGGKAKRMDMYEFAAKANELDAEAIKDGEDMTKGEAMLRNLQSKAAKGDPKAMKLWTEIKQFGEAKRVDITSGGNTLPPITIVPNENAAKQTFAHNEQDIED